MTSPSTPFPTIDLVPKRETNVLSFIKEFPKYDGRDVVVGILDTGIDPGAHAIQYMADGVTPKLIDIVDCTGSGDVDVSTEVQVAVDEESGCYRVEGLTGRNLKLCKSWNFMPFPTDTNQITSASMNSTSASKEPVATIQNPTVRLGVKRAFELYPAKLLTRVKQERKKLFDAQLAKHIADVHTSLAKWKADLGENDSPSTEQVKDRDDLQARLEVLTSTEITEDPGPLFDCVVFYDGSEFRAIIDVSETGDLTGTSPMARYALERQFGTFGTADQLNYGVNFYKNGRVLSIVTDSSPHGTHVAGITAAAEGERSGVAPGAKLVSFKIGDGRLGTMETGASLTRALIEAVKHQCDVINLSFGEGCTVPNSGRFVELSNDIVWKHNIVFVSSAGNNGPALSTVGAPGGTSSACIGVAAYVSPQMMKANYSMNVNGVGDEETHPGTTYTWSSAGPAVDGDNGVDLAAPGGAIASVSNWCLQKSMLMNGTSMSSPHATGCIALLISGCKAEGIPVSPARIRRALQNTAEKLPQLTVSQQGWGIIQVDKAFEYLRNFKDIDAEDIHFDVRVDNLSGNPRGIYLRQLDETSVLQTFVISVVPQFRREDSVSEEVQRCRINFEMEFCLESSASWVLAPDHFMLVSNGRDFKIHLDPTSLEPGLHTARVCAFDSLKPERKVIFSVPITVAKPMPVASTIELGRLAFQPAETKRFFVLPPLGATWMDITIKDCRCQQNDTEARPKMIVLHTVQLLPHAAYRDFEKFKAMNLSPSQVSVTSLPVEPGVTCEVDISRYWSTVGSTEVDVSIEFRGVRPVPNRLQIISGTAGSLARIFSDLKHECVCPRAKLTTWLTPLRPKRDASILPLGDRDKLPSHEKEIYELILSYELTQEEKGEITLRAFALQGVLYESAYESQLLLVFDGEKKYLGAADAWPSSIAVPKGKVIVKAQIRHDDPTMLEKLKDMIIHIERKLDKEIVLSVYSTKEDLMKGTNSFNQRTLRKGCSASVFFAEPQHAKLPSNCKPGDFFVGQFTLANGETSLPGEGKRPGGFPLSYWVGPRAEKPKESECPEENDERTAVERYMDSVRDLKVSELSKLGDKDRDAFETLYMQAEQEYPDHLPLLLCRLRFLDQLPSRATLLTEILAVAEKITSKIQEDDLAKFFGRKSDSDDPAVMKLRKEMKDLKSVLIETLARKALAYADLKAEDADDKFSETLKHLKEWVDIDGSDKYAALVIERDMRAFRYGAILKLVNKLLGKDNKDKDAIRSLSKDALYKKRAEMFGNLGFEILKDYDLKMRVISCPKSFALF